MRRALISTLHADGEAWDEVLDSMYRGMGGLLLNLRAYLTYFPGERCSTVMETLPKGGVAGVQAASLGVADTRVSASMVVTPRMGGTVEYRGEREVLLRLTKSPSQVSRSSTPTTGARRLKTTLHL